MNRIIHYVRQFGIVGLSILLVLIAVLPSEVKAFQLEDLASNNFDSLNQVEVHDNGDQSLLVTLNVKNMKLSDVLNNLTRQANVGISYDSEIDIEGLVTMQAKNKPFFTLLDSLLKDSNLEYSVSEDQRVLVVEQVQENSVSENVQEEVTGRIVDSQTGEPLPGVNIVLRGTSTGTSTDSEGRFELTVPNLDAVLIITYIGYTRQEVQLNGQTELDIELVQASLGLDEVVVVGYGSQKRINLTGSVDQVAVEEVNNRGVSNLTQGLQGLLPNVNINPLDGKPTESPAINIRGTTSIGQGGNALVLIDGVEGDPAMLNPNDVESISVLKDASSAAVYGARGSFGVVLITTKEPGRDEISISYNGNVGFKRPTVLPDFNTDPLTYATRFAQGFELNSGNFPQNVNKTLPFSRNYLEELERRVNDPSLPRTDVGSDGLYRYYHGTDWYDLLYKDNLMFTDHNLSVSGGTESTSLMVTGRYQGQNGLFRYNTDDYQMLNLRARGIIDVTDWLQIDNNFDISKRDYLNPLNVGEGGGIWRNIADEGHPLSPMLNPDGTLTHSGAYTVGDFYLGNNNIDSERRIIRNTTEMVANVIDKKVELRANFSFQNTSLDEKRRRVPVPYSRAPGSIEYLGTQYNDLTEQKEETNYITSNVYSEYENEFSGTHYFKAMAGINYERSNFDRVLAQRNGLIFPTADDLNLALGQSVITQGGYEQWQLFGGFTRLNYIYDDRYLFEFNARYDGSSKFPEDERYAFFPSASAGWRISQENFWNISDRIISHLQLRASYGSMGNGNIGSYVFQETFNISQINRIIGSVRPQSTSRPSVLPEGLTWETATTRNVGVDLEMVSGKLQFTGDVYIRETTDMFTRGLTPPAVFGSAPPFGNFADLETRGWELSLSWQDQFQLAEKPFGYNVRLSLSDYTSEITRYNNPDGFLNDYYEGQRVGEIWGYETEGFFRDEADVASHADQSWFNHRGGRGFGPGDIKFRDLNGDGVIDNGENTVDNPGDRRIIGNSSPRYSFGINLGVNWNNFYVNSFFHGVLKQDWYPSSEANHFWGGYNRIYNDTPNWHLEEGTIWSEDNPDSFFPRYIGYIALGSNRSLGAPQTKYLMNVAYIRLKNLQVGYNIPAQLASSLGMQNARVYVTGENLWGWSPLYQTANNVDVEAITSPSDQRFTGSNSGDGLNYPRLSSLAFGLSFKF